MFDVPGSDVTTVVLNDKAVRGEEAAVYIRANKTSNSELEEDSGLEEDGELKMRQS